MKVQYGAPNYQPPDLPITSASICTRCGQLLHPSNERIGLRPKVEFQIEPDHEPAEDEELDFETWRNIPGTWIQYCPHCDCLFSAKPPRPVVIIDTDMYPQIEDLIQKRDSLQEKLRIHQGYLDKVEIKLASVGPLSLESLGFENIIDHEREQILTLEQELHTVEQKIQNRLGSRRL